MPRIKRRTFSGAVCEQEVYTVGANIKNLSKAKPRERFKTEEERKHHKTEMSRRHHIRLVNENFNPSSLYSTYTFSDDYEVHTFQEAKKVRENFARCLKRANPDSSFIIYMGRGKGTHRIHFHMLSNGLSKDLLREKWKYGVVLHERNLRVHNFYDGVDHGQDYTGLANYLFDHWTPEQGGHRWRPTRNLQIPKPEKPTMVKRNYSPAKPPVAPKGYKLVDFKTNSYGYMWFKYVMEPGGAKTTMKC